jgi:hypothetical protein
MSPSLIMKAAKGILPFAEIFHNENLYYISWFFLGEEIEADEIPAGCRKCFFAIGANFKRSS